MKRALVLAVAVVLLGSGSAWGRLGGAGTQFLAIGGGARSSALGGAVSATSGDLESVYWNPAGIAFLEGTAFGFTHTMLYADMSLEDVAVATPAMDGVVGVSGLGFLSGDIEETTEEMPDGTGQTFNANAFALTLTYARLMTDKFAAGVSFRFVREGLGEVAATNWGFDLGGTYRVGFGNLRLGFAVMNFGPDMQLSGDRLEAEWVDPDWEDTQDEDVPVLLQSEAYPMPMTFRAGLSYDVLSGASGTVTASVEGIHPVDQDEALGAGLQYCYADRYFLRVGYTGFGDLTWDRIADWEWPGGLNGMGLALGGGVRIPTGSVEMCVDYCFQDHEYLDPIHRIAVGFIPRG